MQCIYTILALIITIQSGRVLQWTCGSRHIHVDILVDVLACASIKFDSGTLPVNLIITDLQ